MTKAPPSSVRKTTRTIVIVIGALTVAMWALVVFSLVTSRQSALVAASSQGRNLTIAFREEIATILHGVDGETSLIADGMRRERGKFDLYAWGQQIVKISPGIARAVIVKPDGTLRSATADPHPSFIDLNDRDYFRVQLDGKFRGLFIGQTIIGRLLGIPVVPISRRVEAEDGTFLGVIVALISPNALTTLPKAIDLGPHGTMTLAGLDQVIRARFSADSPDGNGHFGESVAGKPRPVDIGENAVGWFVRTSPIDGIPRLYTYGRVGSYPLVVAVGLDLDHELAGWRSLAAMIIAMALGATVLLAGLGAYLIRQTFRDMRATRARTLELSAANVSLEQLSLHDGLTNLANRRFFDTYLAAQIAIAHRHKRILALVLCDVDDFKGYNDHYGHQAGDECLTQVAAALRSCCRRPADMAARYGGEEFAMILPDTGLIGAAKIAEAAREAVVQLKIPHEHSPAGPYVSISGGVAVLLRKTDITAQQLIEAADQTLYRAKQLGRNRMVSVQPEPELEDA